jgi:hypothetical protein
MKLLRKYGKPPYRKTYAASAGCAPVGYIGFKAGFGLRNRQYPPVILR